MSEYVFTREEIRSVNDLLGTAIKRISSLKGNDLLIAQANIEKAQSLLFTRQQGMRNTQNTDRRVGINGS